MSFENSEEVTSTTVDIVDKEAYKAAAEQRYEEEQEQNRISNNVKKLCMDIKHLSQVVEKKYLETKWGDCSEGTCTSSTHDKALHIVAELQQHPELTEDVLLQLKLKKCKLLDEIKELEQELSSYSKPC